MTIPSDSYVDIDDIMYTAPNSGTQSEPPSNTNPRDEALLCVTDLVDCCAAPNKMHGGWYFPDQSRVLESNDANIALFLANRGPNQNISGQQFYGSVRLYRRYSNPPERGHFYCELPSAADPNVTQILYANISELIMFN